MNKEQLRLYLVTDQDAAKGRDLVGVVRQAVAGGVSMVQLREKTAKTRDFIALGQHLMEILRPMHIPLLVNDRVDFALAIGADGVHIGQSDKPYILARQILGADKIIGLSVENMDDLKLANALDVDYIGVSPVFSTPTKTDTRQPFGLDGLREAVKRSTHPVVGIGGMNKQTVASVMRCGADGIAVVSAIVGAENPMLASRELVEIISNTEKLKMNRK